MIMPLLENILLLSPQNVAGPGVRKGRDSSTEEKDGEDDNEDKNKN